MAMSFSEGLRYAAYGIVVAGAAIAYFALDFGQQPGSGLTQTPS